MLHDVGTATLVLCLLTATASYAAPTSSNISHNAAPPRSPIPYYILEELPAETLIGSVPVDALLDQRYSGVEMTQLRYSLVGQKIVESGVTVELFAVDETSGIVRTLTQIDRDELCPGRVSCVVQLDVLVRPSRFFDVVKIAVEIMDVNDHSPDFGADWSTSGVVLNISESVLPGSTFNLPSAVDADSGTNAVQGYRLLREDNSNPDAVLPFKLLFEPRFSDLRLMVSSKLDRESVDCYRLVVEAYDGDDPIKTGSLKVTVKVVDTNDNAPVFERAVYEFTATETMPAGSVVGKVKATDRDLGVNGRLSYRLLPQSDHAEMFTIDKDTGQIYIRSALDYERSARYHLTVMASDGMTRNQLQKETTIDTTSVGHANLDEVRSSDISGRSSLTAYATVRIKIVDSNDNVPHVSVNTLRSPPDVALLPVNADIDAFVAYVTVADPDSGNSGMVTCSLHEEHASPVHFRLEPLSATQFQIVTSSPVTGGQRSQRRHVVAVICRDLGEDVSKWSRADVVVEVAPPNDNPPQFERDTYECDVTVTSVDDVITTVKAVDVDPGISGQVQYRIAEPYSQLFDVDATIGIVTAKVMLDTEQLASMTFNVIAYDLGVPSRSSTATVRLVIRDDSLLAFYQPSYSFVVFENQPLATEVGQVTAFDPMTSSIRYELIPETAETELDTGDGGAFEINTTTGQIYTKRVLDRERRSHFRLRATARGITTGGRAIAHVSVHVADLNDNQPRVHWPPPTDVINETVIRLSTAAPSGHVIAVISAEDSDEGDNACLSYTIVSGNEDDLFEVPVVGEGRIAVKRSLIGATATRKLFLLRVDVTDRGVPPRSTSAILNIVLDASLPFAPAHKRFVVINNNRTIILVLSSLSSAMFVLLITVALLLRRFAADRKEYGANQQTGSESGGMARMTSSSSRLVRTMLARYRDARRRRAKQRRRSLAVARDFTAGIPRDAAKPRDEELSCMSERFDNAGCCGHAMSEYGVASCSWDIADYTAGNDRLLTQGDNTSAVIIVDNDNVDYLSTPFTFVRV